MAWLARYRDSTSAQLKQQARRWRVRDLEIVAFAVRLGVRLKTIAGVVNDESPASAVQLIEAHVAPNVVAESCSDARITPARLATRRACVELATHPPSKRHCRLRATIAGVDHAHFDVTAIRRRSAVYCSVFRPRYRLRTSAHALIVRLRRLRISTSVARIEFARERPEPELRASVIPRSTPRPKPPGRSKLLPPPPKSRRTPLAARLRMILLPPVDDVLADDELLLPSEPYPYQRQGIAWLYQRESALLADEMGLGKTMQAILAARLLWRQREVQRILVLCPKSLLSNWQREFALWWPHIAPFVRSCDGDRRSFLRTWRGGTTVKLMNLEALAREASWLRTVRITADLVIVDEAQRIKNPDSSTAQAVKALRAGRKWALTGTPLENRVEDLRSIFEFLQKGLLRRGDADHVREAIAPYTLRRTAEHVELQLPELIDQEIEVDLLPAQRAAYQRAERDGVVRLNRMGDSVTITHVLQLIMFLRQICNFDPNTGASAKLNYLRDDLEEIAASGRKALVFSQFTNEHGLLTLERALRRYRPSALHGKVPSRARDHVLRAFETDPDRCVLLLNYRTGGVGLNLHAANYVFLFDRWWNPAVEDQAVRRAHRIGQSHPVFVRRFVCRNTIEERILAILRKKRALFDEIIDESRPDRSIGLTEEELFGLFDLRFRPRRRAASRAPRISLESEAGSTRQAQALVARIYEAEGYSVEMSGPKDSADNIVVERIADGVRERILVCYCGPHRRVGRAHVEDLIQRLRADPRFTLGHLITLGEFTSAALRAASKQPIRLINGTALRQAAERHGVADVIPRSD